MNTRQQRAAATREHLLDAGLRLAEHTGLAGMSVNLIVEKADVAKGMFFHYFADRTGFVVALHREFHGRLFAEITEAAARMPPGRDRLLSAAGAYLDSCLRHRGIHALLLEARAEPVPSRHGNPRRAERRRTRQGTDVTTPVSDAKAISDLRSSQITLTYDPRSGTLQAYTTEAVTAIIGRAS